MRRVKLMLFFLPVVLAGAVALSVIFLPGHASATSPTHTTVDLTGNFSLPTSFTGCSFVINASQTGTGYVTTFYDDAGNITDVFTRTPGLTVTYYSQSGKTYTSNSPATTHVDVVNNTITYDGLEQHIVVPGQGLIGAATGHVMFNTQTGALLVADGQSTFLTPFSQDICNLLAQ